MRSRITESELRKLADKEGFVIQHDCGGYRVTRGDSYIYPNGGVCPTATRRECWIFLKGCQFARRQHDLPE